MYTLLINKDNTIETTNKSMIMQRSNNVDNLLIMVDRYYKNIDLGDATVLMEYVLPISKSIKSIFLELGYEDRDVLNYIIPANTLFTAEPGTIELSITFIKLDIDDTGKQTAYIRKTQSGTVDIFPVAPWMDFVPDERLSELDQRLLVIEACQRNQDALNQEIFNQTNQKESIDAITYLDTLAANDVSIKNMEDFSSTNRRE